MALLSCAQKTDVQMNTNLLSCSGESYLKVYGHNFAWLLPMDSVFNWSSLYYSSDYSSSSWTRKKILLWKNSDSILFSKKFWQESQITNVFPYLKCLFHQQHVVQLTLDIYIRSNHVHRMCRRFFSLYCWLITHC